MRYRMDPLPWVTIVLLALGQMVDGTEVPVDDGEDAVDDVEDPPDVVEIVDVGGGSSNDVPEPVFPDGLGSRSDAVAVELFSIYVERLGLGNIDIPSLRALLSPTPNPAPNPIATTASAARPKTSQKVTFRRPHILGFGFAGSCDISALL